MRRFIILALILTSTLFAQGSISSEDIEARIDIVLEQRDIFYSQILGENKDIDSLLQSGSSWKLELSQNHNKNNIWHAFLTGVSNPLSETLQNSSFEKCLKLAGTDRANLWILLLEFIRIKNYNWAERTLINLDKANLQQGIYASTYMENQLVLLSSLAHKEGHKEEALRLLDFAYYFSNNPTQIITTQIALGGSSDNNIFSLFDRLMDNIKNDLSTQLFALDTLARVVIIILAVIFVLIMITVATRTLTRALHAVVCKFPHTVPYSVRLVFMGLILLSVTVLGIYPLLIILGFVMGPYIKTKTFKALYNIAMILLVLYPAVSVYRAARIQVFSQKSPLGIFHRALSEAPEEPLVDAYDLLESGVTRTNEQQAILKTSIALCQLKSDQLRASRDIIDNALTEKSNSEPALLTAGAIYYGTRRIDESSEFFQTAVESYPASTSAQFNYGQLALLQANTQVGNQHISNATTAYPSRYNDFLAKNATYYGKNRWPLTRQFILSDISTQYFWKNRADILGNYVNTLTTELWGSRFLGLNPLFSLGAIIVIFLFMSMKSSNKKKGDKVTPCPLCGKPTCRNCREEFCHDCHSSLSVITNKDLVTNMKIKLANAKKLRIRLRAQIANMIIPGTMDLHLKGAMGIKDIFLFIASIIVYSAYVIIWTDAIPFILIPQYALIFKIAFTIPLVIFNMIFIIRFVSTSRKEHLLGKK